jgi:predicted amidophosphoribosyltransferase
MQERKPTEFEQAAADGKRAGLAREFIEFLKTNKKWWLLPILVTFLVLALLVLLSSTGVAPFIYTLF